jgi:hypothetical protein
LQPIRRDVSEHLDASSQPLLADERMDGFAAVAITARQDQPVALRQELQGPQGV